MGDWDFLYEMNERGYSPDEIADAAGAGMAPWEDISIELIDSELPDGSENEADWIQRGEPFQSRDGYLKGRLQDDASNA